MKKITSKKNKKEQIIPDEVWDNIVLRGWQKRYTVEDIPVRPLRNVPQIREPEILKPEVKKTKTKKSNG